MLVHRHRVEAELLAVLQLVEVAVVELVRLLGVVIPVRQPPHCAVLARRGDIDVGIGHQVKQDYLHTMATNSSGFSTCGRCPASFMM